jgi:hypothetical protein
VTALQALWLSTLKFNPLPVLLSSGNSAVAYFAKRDLLQETVEPIKWVWQLPEVKRLFAKQQSDGSWRHSGKETVHYPPCHYTLAETWKNLRIIVEQYQVDCSLDGVGRAAEFLFACQTEQGDIRGMLANQYATYYTGAMLATLIKAGYADDPRVERGLLWLLSMRQNDGGWSIPILTHDFDMKTYYNLTSQYAEPIEPDRCKPFSHNWTDMVLRAFAAHPQYRRSPEAQKAADLLKTMFFRPDVYSSYQDPRYWVRFRFWWPNLLTALESLSEMGYSKDDSDIKLALNWLVENQLPDALWLLEYNKKPKKVSKGGAGLEERLWLALRVARVFKKFYE